MAGLGTGDLPEECTDDVALHTAADARQLLGNDCVVIPTDTKRLGRVLPS